jgi:ABC-type sugar transport system permease subunit
MIEDPQIIPKETISGAVIGKGKNVNKSASYKKGDGISAFLFLSPTLIIFCTFILFPVFFSFYLSFHQWNMFGGEAKYVAIATNNEKIMFKGTVPSV